MMQLPYSENLSIERLGRLFDKMSESYKIFWFQAIVNKVISGKETLTYQELINEMLADSWYMVSEYKLNLGPSDTLEALVHYIYDISGLKASEKKANIINYLEQCKNKRVVNMKRTLTYFVPYRLQAPFVETFTGSEWNISKQNLVARMNQEKRLMYYYTDICGLDTSICLRPEWCIYIRKNHEILKGWIQYNLIMYLQRRNPNIPGISNKLEPPQDRKLNKVIKYWKTIMEITPVSDIYGNEILMQETLSIDHFIPWSYVAHDEFWNLHPTTKSINSSKSNNLPAWERYFPALCEKEFFSYQMMWRYDVVHKEFLKCSKEHINSGDVMMKLYREDISEVEFRVNLENILLPLYNAARNAGFKDWFYLNTR
ncbi:HNH endonuclease domain-containing protein [Lacrimispora sphenoides]|uniref:HNH endonuclease n=1 Tax=Lacrimispora sphenoides JCM 1415 TaxID=1297793 RepID=A0ABY1CHU2_9FIRM|nr:HNH endonuclease domain-containing protein [Lacrimispora sphenoides]SEU03560.1 HNH endonuclease [[Clostridium] sphenoides JCM 1415]SUY48791.1 HNH endonuclease [Lacrimispora sphenoides]